jgi:hypothetical protein
MLRENVDWDALPRHFALGSALGRRAVLICRKANGDEHRSGGVLQSGITTSIAEAP